MSWLGRVFGRSAQLSPAQAARLRSWKAAAEPRLDAAMHATRFVVVDVETSGLDVHADRLIAIGAAAVTDGRIDFGDAFYKVLRQQAPSAVDNILVHGIGGADQTGGEDPAEALLAFVEYTGKSPLVAFHAPFDETMLARAMREHLGEKLHNRWLDLAWLGPALLPEKIKLRALDDWLEVFDIPVIARHDAIADVLATAQLFQILCRHAVERGMHTAGALIDTAEGQRWMGRK